MSKASIVIAISETQFRESVATVLAYKGFDVASADNGEHLLELLQRGGPVVAVLDSEVILPRVRAASPEVKVILLASQGEEAAARQAFAAGVYDYLCIPCDVDILAARIGDAVDATQGRAVRERRVTEVMIPIDAYTCVQASNTVREGIEKLRSSSEHFISSGLIMETGHRAVLVFDGQELVGVLTMRNLIQAIRPGYMTGTTGILPQCLRHSRLFWRGLFTKRAKDLESMAVRTIMNPRPPVVGYDANLMQVAQLLCEENRRRVAVEWEGQIVGVVREQELFHEISRLILSRA